MASPTPSPKRDDFYPPLYMSLVFVFILACSISVCIARKSTVLRYREHAFLREGSSIESNKIGRSHVLRLVLGNTVFAFIMNVLIEAATGSEGDGRLTVWTLDEETHTSVLVQILLTGVLVAYLMSAGTVNQIREKLLVSKATPDYENLDEWRFTSRIKLPFTNEHPLRIGFALAVLIGVLVFDLPALLVVFRRYKRRGDSVYWVNFALSKAFFAAIEACVVSFVACHHYLNVARQRRASRPLLNDEDDRETAA